MLVLNDLTETLQKSLTMKLIGVTQWSAATSTLIIPLTHRSALDDHTFPVLASRAWNALPSFVTALILSGHEIFALLVIICRQRVVTYNSVKCLFNILVEYHCCLCMYNNLSK